MTRKLSFTRIGTTEDTGDPVVRAKFDDTGSYLDAIITDERSTIRVWMVESKAKGDMKRMLDAICRQLDTGTVHILEPDMGPLEGSLRNAERHEEMVETPHGKKKSVYLAVEWEYDSK